LKRYFLATAIFCAGAVSGCEEKNTTSLDLSFLEVNPRTVEALIPFGDFVDDVQVFGGYGSAADLGRGFVGQDFGGLDARTLVHVGDYPTISTVVPGTLSFSTARVVLFFDTLRGTLDGPVAIQLFDVQEQWHPPTVTWEAVVDTAGDRRAWSQPGGGVTTLLGEGTFDITPVQPPEGGEAGFKDSVSIRIDSATVAALGDGTSGTTGLLVAVAQPGKLLHLVDVGFRITTRASALPDSIFEESAPLEDLVFMLDPAPTAPLGWIRVGGTPAWRSVLTMSIPRTITGTPEVCGAVGCEVDLTEVDLNLAELVLTTRQTAPPFKPQDTTQVRLRTVLNPELLPKAPLGPVVPFPRNYAPELFSTQAGTQVPLWLTTLVIDGLRIAGETGTVPVTTIALFSNPEPNILGFTAFEGAGAGAPALRLLYTIANPVGLP
jgi:hypothetical protein